MAKRKFGFHYSRIENVIPPPDFAHLAEEMEFDSVWVPEALVNEVPAGDIMMTMSALVHHSSSITVGGGGRPAAVEKSRCAGQGVCYAGHTLGRADHCRVWGRRASLTPTPMPSKPVV